MYPRRHRERGFNHNVTHEATVFCQKRAMQPPSYNPEPPLFALPPARMDALTHRLAVLARMNPSYKKKDYLLETIALLGDEYPTHLSGDRYYTPLRQLVEDFVVDQRRMRDEASGPQREASRPHFSERLAELSDRLHKAGAEMLSQANGETLQKAHAQDVAAGDPSAYVFKHIAALAQAPGGDYRKFPERLTNAYKADRRDILEVNPDRESGPLQQTNRTLDVLHLARWGMAAEALSKLLEQKRHDEKQGPHYRSYLADPKRHLQDGWADGVGRGDAPKASER